MPRQSPAARWCSGSISCCCGNCSGNAGRHLARQDRPHFESLEDRVAGREPQPPPPDSVRERPISEMGELAVVIRFVGAPPETSRTAELIRPWHRRYVARAARRRAEGLPEAAEMKPSQAFRT